MENQEEIWRDVPNYEGYYQVSNLGRVRSLDRIVLGKDNITQSLKGKILIHSYTRKYPSVGLHVKNVVKTKQIHRLMALAFIENPLNKAQVNHKNGIKTDNRLENLEWATQKENNVHARETGLMNQNGEDSVNSKLTKEDVLKIREMAANGLSSHKIAEEINIVCQSLVSKIIRRKRWKHI